MDKHEITLQEFLDQGYSPEILFASSSGPVNKRLTMNVIIRTDGGISCEMVVTVAGERKHTNNTFSLLQAIEEYNKW